MKVPFAVYLFLLITISISAQDVTRTKILVLGTPHLEQLENFHPNYLQRVLDSLKVKNFDVVAIENMPAELLLDIKGRTENHWQELYDSFKKAIEFGMSHQKKMNLTYEEARANIERLNLNDSISDRERIDYINSYLCSYDVWSATLFYKQLNDKSSLSTTVIELLERLGNSKNEINTIGVEIAKTNNLRRIHYIDNLQDETLLLNEFPMFLDDYQSNSKFIEDLINESKFYEKLSSLENEAINGKDFYPLYRFYNSEAFMKGDFESQWALWFKTNFKSKTDRSRYALWEMRNLSIAATMLSVVASNPEKKILVIIGASHKSFLEKYLKQIPDIELMDF